MYRVVSSWQKLSMPEHTSVRVIQEDCISPGQVSLRLIVVLTSCLGFTSSTSKSSCFLLSQGIIVWIQMSSRASCIEDLWPDEELFAKWLDSEGHDFTIRFWWVSNMVVLVRSRRWGNWRKEGGHWREWILGNFLPYNSLYNFLVAMTWTGLLCCTLPTMTG